MDHREQVSHFKQEHLDSLKGLDLATKSVLNAIVKRQDSIFRILHEAQLRLTRTLHENTMTNIADTRQEIIQEIRVIFFSSLCTLILTLFSDNGRILPNRTGA
jgi:hypothetical protein